jgi:hypothetical protein
MWFVVMADVPSLDDGRLMRDGATPDQRDPSASQDVLERTEIEACQRPFETLEAGRGSLRSVGGAHGVVLRRDRRSVGPAPAEQREQWVDDPAAPDVLLASAGARNRRVRALQRLLPLGHQQHPAIGVQVVHFSSSRSVRPRWRARLTRR